MFVATNYDGNLEAALFAAILPDYVDYDPGESLSSIRLYRGDYMVVFEPGKS